jgi:hypothetical protein
MSYFLTLTRRTARLRLTVCSSFLVAALACSQDDTVGPISTATPQDPAAATPTEALPDSLALPDTSALPDSSALAEEVPPYDQGAPETPEPAGDALDGLADDASAFSAASFSSASTLRTTGIPFGDFHLPVSNYGRTYSGSLAALWPSFTKKTMEAARSKGMRLVISMAGARSGYTVRGRFSMSKWKAKINQYRRFNFGPYVKDGTVLGHYLVDEPFCNSCWGGRAISYSEIEEMARYSKSIWPSMPTGVRAPPTHLGSRRFSRLDFAWAQWEGPLHVPSYRMTPERFRDEQTAAARRLGLGLVFGLNYLDAGDGSSHINGTYAKDPRPSDRTVCTSRGCYRYAMSASEVRRVGRVLASASYGCALLSWKYNTTFIGRSGMRSALAELASVAKNRARSSCNR